MSTPTILRKIIARKQQEVQQRLEQRSLAAVKDLCADLPPCRGFAQAICKRIDSGATAVIAEVKKASPSKGVIRDNFDPTQIAKSYAQYGATCLSVLTDVDFFQGHDDYLIAAKKACELPILRKDFTIDDYQIWEARSLGADCILLIAAVLPLARLQALADTAEAAGLDVLVEVHNQAELDQALTLSTPLLGINNRDLHTFDTRLQTSITLSQQVPDDKKVICESGIHLKSDVQMMLDNNIYGFLVGEAFMRADNPGAKMQQLFG